MTDHLSKTQRSKLMSRVKPKNSLLELSVFSHLRKEDIYFRKHYRQVQGTPDIARPAEKKAVFIHSDFWHGWQFSKWSDKLSSEFWRTKIETNKARDRRKIRQLRALGWKVMVLWEHSLKRNPAAALQRVVKFLSR